LCKTAADFGCLDKNRARFAKNDVRFCTTEKHKRIFWPGFVPFFRDAFSININLVLDEKCVEKHGLVANKN